MLFPTYANNIIISNVRTYFVIHRASGNVRVASGAHGAGVLDKATRARSTVVEAKSSWCWLPIRRRETADIKTRVVRSHRVE